MENMYMVINDTVQTISNCSSSELEQIEKNPKVAYYGDYIDSGAWGTLRLDLDRGADEDIKKNIYSIIDNKNVYQYGTGANLSKIRNLICVREITV